MQVNIVNKFWQKIYFFADKFFNRDFLKIKPYILSGISIGNFFLKLLAEPTVESMLDLVVTPSVITIGEGIVKQVIVALTEAEIIINQPDERLMLVALANYVRTLPVAAHHMWVSKLVSLIVKFADGHKLPEDIYDMLTQSMYSRQKIGA